MEDLTWRVNVLCIMFLAGTHRKRGPHCSRGNVLHASKYVTDNEPNPASVWTSIWGILVLLPKKRTDLSFFILVSPAELQSRLPKPPWEPDLLTSVLPTNRGIALFSVSLKWGRGGKLSKLVLVDRFGLGQRLKIKDWAEYQCDHRWLSADTYAKGFHRSLLIYSA